MLQPQTPQASLDDGWKRYLAPTAQWQQNEKYLCRKCNGPIGISPHSHELLGCVHCNIIINPGGYERHLKQRA